ncbi:MAG: amidohydrolase family protein [Chloroflexi bacterium]|nr:amidohydrolase family protein [Chloroflexota bacterium]
MTLDAFPHIIPAECLERFNLVATGPALDFLRGLRGRANLAPMWDLDARFRSMDAVDGYVQVLTLCLPPIEQMARGAAGLDLARLANDTMAELVRRHPDRFVGFAASLPLDEPETAIRELDRAVHDLSALGAQVFTNSNGEAMDAPRFEALWTRLEELDACVWVHGARQPTTPDFKGESRSRFGLWAALGWPYEMGMFAARMVASGVLERHPRLRFLLHHSGGMLPTFSRRVNGSWLELQAAAEDDEAAYAQLPRPPAEYFAQFYADTSGQTPVAIRAAIEFLGADHVLLGSDAPFSVPADHLATLSRLRLPDDQYALLVGGNAQRELRLKLDRT